jgi:peptidoglycan pentaglycine glycine transferase (the first glycine)
VNSAEYCHHLLQHCSWGEFKSHFGWTATQLHSGNGSAQVLFRSLPLGMTIAYIPKGPELDWTDSSACHAFFSVIHLAAKKRRAIFLKVEPNVWEVDAAARTGPAGWSIQHTCRQAACNFIEAATGFLHEAGFVSADTVQPRTSLVIDISSDEATILAAMKQKTRYNIRLAEKKGVTVRQGSRADVASFYHLSRITATRDGFPVHGLDYYQTAYDLFAPDRCALLIAEFEHKPLAALMIFRHEKTAYYFYGASANEHRELMPTYLIQWAAIGWAKTRGCTCYDLWGIPDADVATLETDFRRRSEGLWGVYRFKRGFGGQVIRSVGAYDYIYNAPLYRLYRILRKL